MKKAISPKTYFAYLLLAAAIPKGVAAQTAVLLEKDGFDGPKLNGWALSTSYTETTAALQGTGESWLDIDKKDTTGTASLVREFVVPAGHYVRLSADLRTVLAGPFSEFAIRATQLDGAGKVIEDGQLAFNDGFSVSSVFGGSFKTPQTLGEWKRTRHQLKMAPATAKLRVTFVFRTGQQHVLVDNFQLDDLGTAEPAPESLPFYQKPLDSAAGLLDLDMLIPGVTYEVTATAATEKTEGMDVAAAWIDLKGRTSEFQPLTLLRKDGPTLAYSYTVPERAVGIRLELRNADLTALGWNHEKEYRRWKDLSIRTLSMPAAPDTIFYNYIRNVAKNPGLIKPREMVEVTDLDKLAINAGLAKRATEDAAVAPLNGGLALKIGDQFVPPIVNASLGTQNRYDVYGELGRQGLNLIRVEDAPGGPSMGNQWPGPQKFDFSSVDAQIYGALKQNPEARIVYMITGLFPPGWWGEQNPDEILRDADGLALGMEDKPYAYRRRWGKMDDPKFRAFIKGKGGCYYPSPASEPYRAAMREYLIALRRYIESQPYGKAVVGYKLVWGYDGQWGWPVSGSNADEIVGVGKTAPHEVDYSQPMTAYFRRFLQKKYGDDAGLRKAWNDPQASLKTAVIPGRVERDPSMDAKATKPYPYFVDLAKNQRVVDYNACYAEVVGDLLADMGQSIKAATPRKILTLAYFQDVQRDLGEELVLNSPGLDISGGPLYDAREVGLSGISPQLYSSFALHGKLDFTEVDHRLFPVMIRNYKGNQVFETPRKSISILEREFGRQMVNNGGGWTLDMGLGWFAQPLIAEEMGKVREVFTKTLSADRSSSAKVALFIGDYSWQVKQTPRFNIRPYYFAKYLRATLAQSGIAVDVYQLADLPKVAGKYKVFLFPFAQGITDKDRANIDAVKRDGNVLVFGSAAGFVTGAKSGVEQVRDLTGMDMLRDDSLPFTVKVNEGIPAEFAGLRGYLGSEEADHRVTDFPMFAVTDPKATSLAEYVDGGNGKTGIAVKDLGNWKSVYLGAVGNYPPELFRGIARLGGAHIYSEDGDALWANKGLVAVHASSDGSKTLRLPQAAHVVSLWDGRDLGTVQTITRTMKTGDNALYMLQAK